MNRLENVAAAVLLVALACVDTATAQTTTVTFDSPAPPGSSFSLLNGEFQGIDFGTGQWRWEGPYNVDPTNHIFFDSPSGTSRTFQFSPAPRILMSLQVFTSGPGTLTLSDDQGQTVTRTVETGALQLVTTGWAQASTVITVTFTSGWNLGIDDITYSGAGGTAQTTTVTFDTPAPPGSSFDLLNGEFQGMDFGTGQWRWEGPYNVDPTNHIFFDSTVGTSRTFRFSPAPQILTSLRVFTTGAGILTLTDDRGQTITRTVATGALQLVTTGWAQASTGITVAFTSGQNLGIDDITYSGGGGADGNGQAGGAGYALRFYGNGVNDIDRVKVLIDDPLTTAPGPPADVGATDFTLEFWLRALAVENPAPAVACGANNNWIYGNIVVDRDRYNQDRAFGLSIAGGVVVFGVSGDGTGDGTICGTTNVLDGQWHHIAVQRRRADGGLWLYVDGRLEAQGDGPDGDISYPDDGVPGNFCGGPCINSDPYLVLGAEKHDAGPQFPSFAGWLDEVRLSTVLRYAAPFPRPATPFLPDANTAALYHFDAGSGDVIIDTPGVSGGPSHGVRRFGGSPAGPEWVVSDAPLAPGTAQTGQ